MQKTKLTHKNYTLNGGIYQLKLPLNIETIIPENDSVRLLSQFVEGMDLTDLYSTYERINSLSPRTLLKIVLYSYMNGDYSSRSIEQNCKRYIYICKNNKKLRADHIIHSKSKTGYVSEKTIYKCECCKGCPYKSECIKGNNCKTPIEDRTKILQIAKTFIKQRKADLERIISEEGSLLRMNRSIQAEGSFGDLKQDMHFRRYLSKGTPNVLAESILLAIARNMNKLHNKIQKGKTGTHLFNLKSA